MEKSRLCLLQWKRMVVQRLEAYLGIWLRTKQERVVRSSERLLFELPGCEDFTRSGAVECLEASTTQEQTSP